MGPFFKEKGFAGSRSAGPWMVESKRFCIGILGYREVIIEGNSEFVINALKSEED